MIYIIYILLFLLVFFVYFCIKFAMTIIRIQDAIEDSLDKIDQKYRRLNEILAIPVFFDSPEIKRIINEIYDIRNIVLDVANKLSGSVNKNNEIEDDEEEI